jgi:hypothetical protein
VCRSTPLFSPSHIIITHITHAHGCSLRRTAWGGGGGSGGGGGGSGGDAGGHWNHESTATVGAIKASDLSIIKVLYHCVTTCLEKERSLATLPPLPPLLPPLLLLPRAPFL